MIYKKSYVRKGAQMGAAIGGLSGMVGADSLGEMAAGGVGGMMGGAVAGAGLGMAFGAMDRATKPMMQKKKTNGKKRSKELGLIQDMF